MLFGAQTAPCFLGNGAFSPRCPSWARKSQSVPSQSGIHISGLFPDVSRACSACRQAFRRGASVAVWVPLLPPAAGIAAACNRRPCASERSSLVGSRAADGCPGGCSRRSQPPIPGETALCRQPQHPAPARAPFSSICSGAVSTITATSSSATNPTFDGEIVRWSGKGKSKTGKQPRQVMSLGAVQRMRPERVLVTTVNFPFVTTQNFSLWACR